MTPTDGTLTVAPAALGVTASNASRTYGAANPSFAGAVTGAVNGDTFTESFATPATASSAIGSYAITPTASGANIGNYTVTPTDGTLTVAPAALGVTANNASRTYGAENPSFAGAVTGAVNGDTFTESFATPATASSAIGSYAITPTASGANIGNYTVTPTDGTLTVAPAALGVTANNASRTYGAANPSFAGAVTGAVNGDTFTESFATPATASSAIGSYAITPTASGTNIGNYTPVLTAGVLTVDPAPLIATAASFTRAYGADNPVFTGTLEGVRNGDVLSTQFTTQAESTTAPGQYPVTVAVTGDAIQNYNLTPIPGVLTIAKADTTIALAQPTAGASGAPVQLQAVVKPKTSGSPSGSVRFFDGSRLLGLASLQNGIAVFATAPSQVQASASLLAVYEGDTNFLSSSSAALQVRFDDSAFSIAPAPAAGSATGGSGTTASLPLQVSPGSSGVYPGIVTFAVTGLPVGATATFSPAMLSANSGAQTVALSVQIPNGIPATLSVPNSNGSSGSTITTSSLQKFEPALGGAMLALLVFPLANARRFRQAGRSIALTLLLLVGACLGSSVLTGCAGAPHSSASKNGTVQQPAQERTSYTLTITMTSGGLVKATTAILTVGE